MVNDDTLPIKLIMEPEGGAARRRTAAPRADPSFEPWFDADTGDEFGCCFEQGDEYRIRLHGCGSFAFARRGTVVRGTPDPGITREDFHRVFCRQVLPLVLQWHSWEVLHANGMEMAGACVALCGPSQTGKSTLAYAWRRRGGGVYADDMLPFRIDGATAFVCPLPFRIRARPPARDYFGPLDVDPEHAPDGLPPTAQDGGVPLRAVYFLDRRSREEEEPIHIEATAPHEALPALLAQSLHLHLRDRARNRAMVEHYLTLANAVPIFRLSYPTGLGHVDGILDRLAAHVAELSSGSASVFGVAAHE